MNLGIKCNNESCNNKVNVNINSTFIPVVFCGKECLSSFLDLEFRRDTKYDDRAELNKLVETVIDYTKQIQDELDKFKSIRSSYFELFKGDNPKIPLKKENYRRKWSFEKQNK